MCALCTCLGFVPEIAMANLMPPSFCMSEVSMSGMWRLCPDHSQVATVMSLLLLRQSVPPQSVSNCTTEYRTNTPRRTSVPSKCREYRECACPDLVVWLHSKASAVLYSTFCLKCDFSTPPLHSRASGTRPYNTSSGVRQCRKRF